MTQRLDKVKTDNVRGPNSKLVTNGPKAQNENNTIARTKLSVYIMYCCFLVMLLFC